MDRYENWNYIGSATEYEGVVLFSSSSKLLRYELEKLKERQRHIREKLTAFEERYGQKTEEFLPGFREGKLGTKWTSSNGLFWLRFIKNYLSS